MERFLTKVKPKLKDDAEKWLSTEIQEVVKIYDLDLQRHQLQYKRIEQEIKAVRESELNVHTERLKSHCAVSFRFHSYNNVIVLFCVHL